MNKPEVNLMQLLSTIGEYEMIVRTLNAKIAELERLIEELKKSNNLDIDKNKEV